MDITISLNEEDLDHFRRSMMQAREKNAGLSVSEVCAHATALLDSVRGKRAPDFVLDRMRKLVSLITMIQDSAWELSDEEMERVLGALSYFAEPHDDIPDSVPVFGFLDDAVMIELVLRELRHELEAYEEYCVYRASATSGDPDAPHLDREAWLAQRREELMERMRRRRNRDSGQPYASGRPFSLFRTR